jgi:hypothetical protein
MAWEGSGLLRSVDGHRWEVIGGAIRSPREGGGPDGGRGAGQRSRSASARGEGSRAAVADGFGVGRGKLGSGRGRLREMGARTRRWRGRDCREEDGAGGGWSGGTVRAVDALAPALRCSRDMQCNAERESNSPSYLRPMFVNKVFENYRFEMLQF